MGLKEGVGGRCGKISGPGLLPALLTVNENDLDHGDDEEGHSIQLHLHQDSSDQEHQQDGYQAAQDPNRLGDPAKRGREAEAAEGGAVRCGWGRLSPGRARGQARGLGAHL